MLLRVLTIAVALLFGAQAFATSGQVLVCKYTGKALKACPCNHQNDGSAPRIGAPGKKGCCEIRSDEGASGPVVKAASPPAPHRIDCAILINPSLLADARRSDGTLRPTHGRDPPPRDRLFAFLERFLI